WKSSSTGGGSPPGRLAAGGVGAAALAGPPAGALCAPVGGAAFFGLGFSAGTSSSQPSASASSLMTHPFSGPNEGLPPGRPRTGALSRKSRRARVQGPPGAFKPGGQEPGNRSATASK